MGAGAGKSDGAEVVESERSPNPSTLSLNPSTLSPNPSTLSLNPSPLSGDNRDRKSVV